MGTNVESFVLDLSEFARKKVPEEVSTFMNRIALQLLRDAVPATRVKTGRARGNWQVDITESPHFSEVGGIGNSDPISVGAGVLGVPRDHYAPVSVFNNVPYILFLEDLDGMLEGAVSRARAELGLV